MVESALIFEVEKWGTAPGWVQRFDKLILVTVPDEVKIARFVARTVTRDGARSGRPRTDRGANSRQGESRPMRLCHRQHWLDSKQHVLWSKECTRSWRERRRGTLPVVIEIKDEGPVVSLPLYAEMI